MHRIAVWLAAWTVLAACASTPVAANAPEPRPANPASVKLADNIVRLDLGVDRLLPLHGRIVPVVELQRAVGRAN